MPNTNSTNFPTTPGAFQATNAGGYDAFLSKVLPTPDAPVITAISTDTGASSTDRITTSQNLHISGTSDAGVTVTLERAGVGVLGSVFSSVGGTWTYDYTGTTLAECTYDFVARATGAGGVQSDYSSPEFLVTVDRTACRGRLDPAIRVNNFGVRVCFAWIN
jgi:large repetitive protein